MAPSEVETKTVIFPIERRSQIDVLAVSIVFIILPTVLVVLRVLARRVAHRKLDASDYMIFAACVCANTLQAVAIVMVYQGGVGYHIPEIVEMYGPAPVTKFLKILLAVQLLWALSLSFCKLSILLLYTRIFTMSTMIRAAWATAGLIVAWATATILSGFLICRPFAKNWDPALPGTCGNQVLSYTITGSLNLVTDVIVFLLPLTYLWSLQLRLYKKFVLLITFSLGIFTIVISSMRLVSLQELDYEDITYNIPHALIFGALEPSVGVTLACIPLLRPLLGRTKYSNPVISNNPNSSAAEGRSGLARTPKKGFEPLDDDSSQYRLQPMGITSDTQVRRTSSADGPEDPVGRHQRGPSMAKGISVERSWAVNSS